MPLIATAAQLRAILPAGDATSTDAELANALDVAEAALQDACNVSFTPKMTTETLQRSMLRWAKVTAITATAVNGTAITTPADVRVVDGRYISRRQFDMNVDGYRTIQVTYTHGWSTPPAPVVQAVLRLARYYLLEDPSNLFERATSISTEDATYSLVTPGVRGASFPIPEANAVVNRYGYPNPH